jgi:hypothetical protein
MNFCTFLTVVSASRDSFRSALKVFTKKMLGLQREERVEWWEKEAEIIMSIRVSEKGWDCWKKENGYYGCAYNSRKLFPPLTPFHPDENTREID